MASPTRPTTRSRCPPTGDGSVRRAIDRITPTARTRYDESGDPNLESGSGFSIASSPFFLLSASIPDCSALGLAIPSVVIDGAATPAASHMSWAKLTQLRENRLYWPGEAIRAA